MNKRMLVFVVVLASLLFAIPAFADGGGEYGDPPPSGDPGPQPIGADECLLYCDGEDFFITPVCDEWETRILFPAFSIPAHCEWNWGGWAPGACNGANKHWVNEQYFPAVTEEVCVQDHLDFTCTDPYWICSFPPVFTTQAEQNEATGVVTVTTISSGTPGTGTVRCVSPDGVETVVGVVDNPTFGSTSTFTCPVAGSDVFVDHTSGWTEWDAWDDGEAE